MISRDQNLPNRIRILALIESIMVIFLVMVVLFVLRDDVVINLGIAAVGLVFAIILYVMRHHRWAKGMVGLNTMIFITLIGLIDPLGTQVSGATWSLFLVWPSFIMLMLRDLRWVIIVSLYDLAVLLLSALSSIFQLTNTELLLPRDRLFTMLAIQIVMLIALTLMMIVIGYNQVQSYSRIRGIAQELAEQQAITQQANQELQTNNQRLHDVLSQQKLLDQQVRQLEGSLIRLRDGVFLLPLVGALDHERIESIAQRVMDTLHHTRANHLILDMTSAVLNDQATLISLATFIDATKLLGCDVAVTGLTPAVVRDMVLGNVNMNVFGQTGQLDAILTQVLTRHESIGTN